MQPSTASDLEAQHEPSRVEIRALRRLRTALFGYDVFISYRHHDARVYASELEAQLGIRSVAAFRDARELPAGGDLDGDIVRALRASTALVIVGSPDAHLRRPGKDWIFEEARVFAEGDPTLRERVKRLIVGRRRTVVLDWADPPAHIPWQTVGSPKGTSHPPTAAGSAPSSAADEVADSLSYFLVSRLALWTALFAAAALAVTTGFGGKMWAKAIESERVTRSLALAERSTSTRVTTPGFLDRSLRSAVAAVAADVNLSTERALRHAERLMPVLVDELDLAMNGLDRVRPARSACGTWLAVSDGRRVRLVDAAAMQQELAAQVSSPEVPIVALRLHATAEPGPQRLALMCSGAEGTVVMETSRLKGRPWRPLIQTLQGAAGERLSDFMFTSDGKRLLGLTVSGALFADRSTQPVHRHLGTNGRIHETSDGEFLVILGGPCPDPDIHGQPLLRGPHTTLLPIDLYGSPQLIVGRAKDACSLGDRLILLTDKTIQCFDRDELGSWRPGAIGVAPTRSQRVVELAPPSASSVALSTNGVCAFGRMSASIVSVSRTQISALAGPSRALSPYGLEPSAFQLVSNDGLELLTRPSPLHTEPAHRGVLHLSEVSSGDLTAIFPASDPSDYPIAATHLGGSWVIIDKAGRVRRWRADVSTTGLRVPHLHATAALPDDLARYAWTPSMRSVAVVSRSLGFGRRQFHVRIWRDGRIASVLELRHRRPPLALRFVDHGESVELYYHDQVLRVGSGGNAEEVLDHRFTRWAESTQLGTNARLWFSPDGAQATVIDDGWVFAASTQGWTFSAPRPLGSRESNDRQAHLEAEVSSDRRWVLFSNDDVDYHVDLLSSDVFVTEFPDDATPVDRRSDQYLCERFLEGQTQLEIRSCTTGEMIAHTVIPGLSRSFRLGAAETVFVGRTRRIEEWRLASDRLSAGGRILKSIPQPSAIFHGIYDAPDESQVLVISPLSTQLVDVELPLIESRAKTKLTALTPAPHGQD